ncbi:NAD(P)/FAD-dependent oxidoreductase [Aquimarina sp. AD1]|uniref:NAD(P)/FAD-dependent oxidoreductase n=1 Tax=Aquimarina sp. (strain AD1) TaxID=1714848 RepID=UPI000E53B663|nr:NAD(P)/FAD-dependent oxidoreductase [Aquimarina sp. AD1]AXT55252.1 NAD(P)/FAD-dependent oxidoreductase [Aquimarina sp. AD1]RKN18686.1 FAD-dependent oxidoreductase [Aquimarina sp. AD1]
MNSHKHIVIIGGGLAGLTSAIHLAKYQIPVLIIEKDQYPKHKVCGEYISNEIMPYFDFLGIKLDDLGVVKISELNISTTKGKIIKSKLPLGGFGISRYTLDNYLWNLAKSLGVQTLNDQVLDVGYKKNRFSVKTANNALITSDYVIGAYGKRSILDKKLERDFSKNKSPWLAVKAHYKSSFNPNTVALHNFDGGYCGLSMVENNTVNACYLVNYDSFKRCKDIDHFEENVLKKNPYLKDFFENSQRIFEKPITISQINFDRKQPVENHVFMLGDAAGLIHPLCGNGMAMAIQSAKILCELLINNYESNIYTLEKIEELYSKEWKTMFSKRLYAGRILQKMLLNETIQQIGQKVATLVPVIVPKIIKQTHGKPLIC